MIRADHPLDIKRGGVCIYHKDCLAVAVLNFTLLSECIIVEIVVDNKKVILLTLYRSPSQCPETFPEFLNNFEIDLQTIYSLQPLLFTVLGDFNAKSSNWCSDFVAPSHPLTKIPSYGPDICIVYTKSGRYVCIF
mgnify:CR=1 FL=1